MVSLSLYAQTNISANISSNTTLTVANSPYVVTNSIEVNPGITLTVASGVEIRFITVQLSMQQISMSERDN